MRFSVLRAPLLATFVALAPLGAAITAAAPAAAQAGKKPDAAKKPDKATIDAARAAYGAGEAAYKKGDYDAAVDSFAKANELIPAPQAAFWHAMALDKAGRREDAAKAFEKLLADPGVSKLAEEKIATSKERLAANSASTGKLELTTEPAGASVTVDGAPQMGETPMTLDLKPGNHEVSVSAPGMVPQTFEITVDAAGSHRKTVTLEAMAEEAPPAPVEPPPAEEPADAPAEPPKKRSKVPAYVTLGVAGAAAIVGGIFGAKALGSKSDFDGEPSEGTADDVERNALIADMAFGVALTLGVTGIVLLASGDGTSEAAPAATRQARKSARLVVAPYASPEGGGAAARFAF